MRKINFKITADTLINALTVATKFVKKKNVIPAVNNVYANGKFWRIGNGTTQMDFSISKAPDELKAHFPLHETLSILKGFKGSIIECHVEVVSDYFLWTFSDGKTLVSVQSHDTLDTGSHLTPNPEFSSHFGHVVTDDLKKVLKSMYGFLSNDDLRPAITCMRVSESIDGVVNLVATDAHILNRHSMESNLPGNYLVGNECLKTWNYCLSKYNGQMMPAAYSSTSRLALRVMIDQEYMYVYDTLEYDHKFPHYEDLVKYTDQHSHVYVDAKEFIDIVTKALPVTSKSVAPRLILSIREKDIGITSENIDDYINFHSSVKLHSIKEHQGMMIGISPVLLLTALKSSYIKSPWVKLSYLAPNRLVTINDQYCVMPVMIS